MTTLPAQLALKYKCSITPISINRVGDKFNMEIHKQIVTKNMDNSEENKVKISLKINEIIEKMIVKDQVNGFLLIIDGNNHLKFLLIISSYLIFTSLGEK